VDIKARKIKFGVWLPVYGGWLLGAPVEEPEISYKYVEKSAIEAENCGFDSIWVPDHLLNPRKGESISSLEAWTTLTALAVRTHKVRLGHAVLCQGFRYPAVLAKMSATIDEISEGRFILAIGAGWFQREFQAYGIPWSEHDKLIELAEEQLKLIQAMWTRKKVDFEGRYYHITNGVLWPKPIQKPSPPLWYAGNSTKSRQVVINNPDINCWYMSSCSSEKARSAINEMKNRIGSRNIEYAIYAYALISDSDEEAQSRLRVLAVDNSTSINWALNSGLVGSPERVVEKIAEFRDAGINHLTLLFSSTLRDIRTFSEKVINHFK
jgi:FMNH2-dependent dimethyl sulfone monooxygenase